MVAFSGRPLYGLLFGGGFAGLALAGAAFYVNATGGMPRQAAPDEFIPDIGKVIKNAPRSSEPKAKNQTPNKALSLANRSSRKPDRKLKAEETSEQRKSSFDQLAEPMLQEQEDRDDSIFGKDSSLDRENYNRQSNLETSTPHEEIDDEENPFDTGLSSSSGNDSDSNRSASSKIIRPTDQDSDFPVKNNVRQIDMPRFQSSAKRGFMTSQVEFVRAARRQFKGRRDIPGSTNLVGGRMRGITKSMISGNDVPMLGFNCMQNIRGDGFGDLLPVFRRNADATEMAKQGYAVGGLYVLSDGKRITGIQCLFMRLDEDRLDAGDYYHGNWVGERGSDAEPEFVGGDGSLILGLQTVGGIVIEGIGLIGN